MSFRLVVVTNRYPADASDIASPFVHDFCAALAARGVELRVVTPHYPGIEKEQDPWVTRFRWATSNRVLGQLSLFNPISAAKVLLALGRGRHAVSKACREFTPDFVLALWALPSGWWAMHAALHHRVPYAVWCLGTDVQVWGRRPVGRSVVRRILRSARHVYADGFALADETASLADRACRFLPSMRRLKPSGPDHVGSAGDPYFLYFGRLGRAKGVDDLLAACRLLKDKGDLRVVLAGTPDPRYDIESKIRRMDVGHMCRYVGRLAPAELAGYIRHARAVVIPSHRDSIPLVLGEALQQGVPVICSDLPDLYAVLSRYQVGTVFETGNVGDLAQRLCAFKKPPAFSAAAARFLSDFSAETAAFQFLTDVVPGFSSKSVEPETSNHHGVVRA